MKALRAVQAPPQEHAWGEPGLGEVLEFMRLLWAVAHGMNTHSKQMRVSLGVTGRQRLVLRMVGRFPGSTATQLASILHIHPSTLSGVVKRLVKRGYLMRHEDPLDTRRAFLLLTDAGRALNAPTDGTVEAAVERLFLRVSEEQRLAAQELLTALAEELRPRESPSVSPEPAALVQGLPRPPEAP